jgi:hypothetical protein
VTYGTKTATVLAPLTSFDVPTGSAVSVVAVFTIPAVTTQVAATVSPTQTAVKNAKGKVTGMTIKWTAVTNASSYAITYGPVTGVTTTSTTVTPTPVTALSYTVQGATATVPAVSVMATVATTPAVIYQSASSAGLYSGAVASPIAFTATPGAKGTIVLTWANSLTNVNNVTGYKLSWAGLTTPLTFAASSTGASVMGLTTGTSYTFSLVANSILAATTTAAATTLSSAPVTKAATAP